jgi:hypothetical protein
MSPGGLNSVACGASGEDDDDEGLFVGDGFALDVGEPAELGACPSLAVVDDEPPHPAASAATAMSAAALVGTVGRMDRR